MPICKVLGSDCWLDSTGYKGTDIILDWFAHVHISLYLILLGMFLIGINEESKWVIKKQ